MSESPAIDAQSLRRTQSTGDIPTREAAQSARARISASHHRSGHAGHHTNPSSPIASTAATGTTPWLRQAGQASSQPDNSAPLAPPTPPTPLPPELSLLARIKLFLGVGPNASRTRKALVSLVWALTYGFLQAAAIIVVLSIASVSDSPQDASIDQIKACGRPLVAWNCIWIVRVTLTSGLAYWNYLRIRAVHNSPRDVESTSQPAGQGSGAADASAAGQRGQRGDRLITTSAGPAPTSDSEEPALPYNHVYARLSLFSSMLTLTWFLTAHILEYTSVDTCRLSAPLVWWLTFSILCTMYFLVLEVILFGFLVFMVLPFIMLFYSIILLCLGRHPLQNPHYIKPEIGKLPKSIVDRIPLVIYIPPPPDDPSQPISLPKPIHSYPPPPPPSSLRKKRFAFFRKKSSRTEGETDRDTANKKTKSSTSPEAKEGETWEDNWEQCEYPFVRLDGNRAACAICLMDFEEPKRLSTVTKDEEAVKESNQQVAPSHHPEQEVEIPVERITEEERNSLPRLEDAGEGPQPLRLLACGHVFHKTCIDPWLTDVSGRCPVCQRPVELDDVEPKKSRRRQRN
ncbi:hypothetical protein F5I97DRAFT_722104 [Phlebopus sp. FC_14]|nr:hypothetical protein F5I97DRAFT_722104 [Phlebopus sp. FC_14]